MKKSILSFLFLFSILGTKAQSNEDVNTKLCYGSYGGSSPGEYIIYLTNKTSTAHTYSFVYPGGTQNTGLLYPPGASIIHLIAPMFSSGTISATPNGLSTIQIFVTSQIGHTRCN